MRCSSVFATHACGTKMVLLQTTTRQPRNAARVALCVSPNVSLSQILGRCCDSCKKNVLRSKPKQEAVLKATVVRSPLPAGNVIDSSLSSLSSPPPAGREVRSGEGVHQREGGWGEGAGDISSTLPYILHYHMVLRPQGTSHNNTDQRAV